MGYQKQNRKLAATSVNLIHFYKAIPEPMADTPTQGSIWRQNLVLFKGKHYVISATSGKGKTTLLNMVCGIRKDYRGDVFFDETNLRTLNDGAFAELRSKDISCLFQDLRLFPDLTAMENICLSPITAINEADILAMARKLGVQEHLQKPCRKLSLGQQQRIALIRALNRPFQWLLLDEPFSHLDEFNAKLAMDCILETAERQQAGIIATALGHSGLFNDFQWLEL